jgi:hypothetical protein
MQRMALRAIRLNLQAPHSLCDGDIESGAPVRFCAKWVMPMVYESRLLGLQAAQELAGTIAAA